MARSSPFSTKLVGRETTAEDSCPTPPREILVRGRAGLVINKVSLIQLQGYLAHEKTHPLRTLP